MPFNRYLLKCKVRANKGEKIEGVASYLSEEQVKRCTATSEDDFMNPKLLEECFKHRAYRIVSEASSKVLRLVASGMKEIEAKNVTGVESVKMSQAHMESFVVSSFVKYLFPPNGLGQGSMSPTVQTVINDLCCLHALHGINQNSGDFLKDGYLSSVQSTMAMEAELKLLAKLRPSAVGLVDAFDFTDKTLRSALGSYDGNAYYRLYEHAKNHPMNKNKVHEKTYELLRPFLRKGPEKLNIKASL